MAVYYRMPIYLPIIGLAVLIVTDAVSVVIEELAVLCGPANLHHTACNYQHLVVPTTYNNQLPVTEQA
jgi:hypothetical protein